MAKYKIIYHWSDGSEDEDDNQCKLNEIENPSFSP